ncbi:MAG: type II toxin-antitoxin system VapC family toxin [Thermoleophilia bacterium]|nr:type II toxin-antitoxin system VapC family toxin [Thermoleophilia bacterium]
MKIVDTNLLVYAVDEAAAHHVGARTWLARSLAGAEAIGFAWTVLLAFIRVTTNPRIFGSPFTPAEAIRRVQSFLEQPPSTVVQPTTRHAALLRELLEPVGTAGNLTNDAHLAALAIEHGAELCSADADFSRFPRVRWVNPLRG